MAAALPISGLTETAAAFARHLRSPGKTIIQVAHDLEEMSVRDRRAVLAGGCFWGMQDLIRKRPGVLSTRVGYTGGDVPNATYRNHGTHAEAIEIIFDPTQTRYRELLEFFFQIHDPTTTNRQGNDVGDELPLGDLLPRRRTEAASPRTRSPTSTPPGCGRARSSPRSTPAGPFWEAEPEHQDYLERYPDGYTCHFPRPGWVLPRRSDVASRPSSQLTRQSGILTTTRGSFPEGSSRASPRGRPERLGAWSRSASKNSDDSLAQYPQDR